MINKHSLFLYTHSIFYFLFITLLLSHHQIITFIESQSLSLYFKGVYTRSKSAAKTGESGRISTTHFILLTL